MGLFFLFCWFLPKVFRNPKKYSGKPQIPKKTKTNQKHIRENPKNKVVQGFRPTLGYGFVFLFWFSRRFLDNQQNLWEHQQYQRKPKKTKHTFGKTNKRNVQGFQTHPWIWVWLFVFVWFSRRFLENKKTFWKTNNTNENQRTPNKPSGKPKQQSFQRFQTNPWICFSFLYSRRFRLFKLNKHSGKQQNPRDNQNNKKQQSPRVGLKPLTTLFFFCFFFQNVLFVLSLVFFGIFGVP